MAHLDKTKKMHTVSEVSFFIDGWLACSCHPFISWLTPIDTNSAAEKKTDKQMYHLPAAFTVTCPSEILYVCVCVCGRGKTCCFTCCFCVQSGAVSTGHFTRN